MCLGFVLLWKREESILSAGTQIINPRYRMDTDTNGNQLVLSQVKNRRYPVLDTGWIQILMETS